MREIGDHAKIVLDHQNRSVRGHAADEIGRTIDVLVAHARHRLIEQHHLGIDRKSRRELQGSFAAIGDFARFRIGEAGETDVVE